jgi:hypothetical protein
MSRLRLGLPAAVVAVLAGLVIAAPASADAVIPFQNWQVGGTLGLAKLNQNVTLPAGSTFNGSADLTTGQISGDVNVPEFTSTVRIFGIPTKVRLQLEEAQPLQGTFSLGAGGAVTVNASTSAIIHIRQLGLGFLSVPTTCRTSAPVALPLNGSGSLSGLAFDGTTTIPPVTGCGLLGPTLSLLLSGPGNAYHLTVSPPAS